MGLIHPSDLAAFQRDQQKRQSFSPLRRMRSRLRPPPGPPSLELHLGGPEPDVLLAVDSPALPSRAAILDTLGHLPTERVAVLASVDLDLPELSGPSQEITDLAGLRAALPVVAATLSAGHHFPAGALAQCLADEVHGASVVVQHGMLLPLAAPLPEGVHVAAWSEADARFWCSGRKDPIVHVVGSQLLHRAGLTDVGNVPVDGRPVYVGALHGFELPRHEIERVARGFCRSTGARYRPHPGETDIQSRAIHRIWRSLGIEFADPTVPLVGLEAPIVGMWSTGVLEAAAAGLPAWVHHPVPPDWLVEVWDRYDLARWGGDQSPRPALQAVAPAQRVTELLLELAGE